MRSQHIDLLETAISYLEDDDELEPALNRLHEIHDDVMKPVWISQSLGECFDEDLALAELIESDTIVCFPAKVTLQDGADYKFIGLNIRHSDLFMWACSDYEHIEYDDLRSIYDASLQPFGIEKWCCKKRGLQPQRPIREQMKTAECWDDEMEALPKNPDDKE